MPVNIEKYVILRHKLLRIMLSCKSLFSNFRGNTDNQINVPTSVQTSKNQKSVGFRCKYSYNVSMEFHPHVKDDLLSSTCHVLPFNIYYCTVYWTVYLSDIVLYFKFAFTI